MAEVVKPDIRELVGVSVNASALELHENHERALDRVAALGAAALAVSTGADLENVPVAASRSAIYGEQLDPRDVIAGELAPILWHIRYGAQHGLIPKAITLYARWLQKRAIFENFDTPAGLLVLEQFSARVFHEWLGDKCIACGGCGRQELTKAGTAIRPRGTMQRDARFLCCSGCNGTGRARPSHGDRARWLGIPMSWYESERWKQRFNAAITWLGQFHADRLSRPLTAELERRRKRN